MKMVKVKTNLNSSKASGPDCIPVLVLKNCETELLYILLIFFTNLSLVEFQGRYLASFLLLSVIGSFKWF